MSATSRRGRRPGSCCRRLLVSVVTRLVFEVCDIALTLVSGRRLWGLAIRGPAELGA
ncbi:hypothetical protein [Streptomyces sp. NPDC057686]|uniref:hypothetical protein n=1 Tax=Streptomyces sp. NPDC057686 TaxID=3346212 RepID=UPI00368FA7FA